MTPKHPTPWRMDSQFHHRLILDANGVAVSHCAIDQKYCEEIISAANEIGKPVMVKDGGMPKEIGAYALYVSDGTFSWLRITGPNGGRAFSAESGLKADVIAWLRLPDLPVENEFEKAWNAHRLQKVKDETWSVVDKQNFTAGWNAAKGAK